MRPLLPLLVHRSLVHVALLVLAPTALLHVAKRFLMKRRRMKKKSPSTTQIRRLRANGRRVRVSHPDTRAVGRTLWVIELIKQTK
ncbi:hypothetical protein C2845_PM11G06550 [Panicum miliaceum]|uniref:Uncharacterized protein n=1 Tax=Panicum miliaceum TaxID=4540 RepID=A0A3L6RQG5_PANMI|nr:hypothetical protein C2845_PM11G06550 [Panicum miliaceum]